MHTIALPLRPAGFDLILLGRRLEAGFQSYRASLREGRRRLMLCRHSRAYRAPGKLPTSWHGITVRGSYVEPARTFAAERTGS